MSLKHKRFRYLKGDKMNPVDGCLKQASLFLEKNSINPRQIIDMERGWDDNAYNIDLFYYEIVTNRCTCCGKEKPIKMVYCKECGG